MAVVGAGAIGCLFGLRLHESGNDVLLIHHNKDTADHLRRRGVALTELSGRTVRARLRVKLSLSKEDDPDLVLLTVKAYDTENTARSLKKSVGKRNTVLGLQNGLGNFETLSRYLPADSIVAGTTTEAALQNRTGRVLHTGRGVTWIGELKGEATKRSATIKGTFQKAGFRTQVSRNIEGIIWSKAIVNSAINPISALTRVPNGELFRTSHLRDATRSVVSEGRAVAAAKGLSLTPSPPSLLSKVLSSTRRNKSSMLQDIEAGKKTEIRQLNGWIASTAHRLGLPAPFNDLLTELVLGLEASSAPRGDKALLT